MLPTKRSAMALARGARTGVLWAGPDIEPFASLISLHEVVAWAGLEDGDTTSGLGRLGCLRRLIWRLPTRLPGHRLVTPGTILRW